MHNLLSNSFPIVVICGFMANIVSIIVFSRKFFRKTIFFTYFRVLTITNTLTLILCLITFFKNHLDINVEHFYAFSCKLVLTLAFVVPASNGWIVVAISVDRLLTLKWAFRFVFIKNAWFQLMICAGIFSLNHVFYIQTLFTKVLDKFVYHEVYDNEISNHTYALKYKDETCFIYNDDLFNWLDLFNSFVIPFSLMILFSWLILKNLDSYKRVTREVASLSHNQSQAEQRKLNITFAYASVSLNLLFLLLNVPICLYNILDELSLVSKGSIFAEIAQLLYYLNSGSVFYASFISNPFFRKEMLCVFQRA
jgi:hypothetical protein